MALFDSSKIIDARDFLSWKYRVRIDERGRLLIPRKTMQFMGIDKHCAILICPVSCTDFAVIVGSDSDTRAFPVKCSAQYGVVCLMKLLNVIGVPYSKHRIVYDVRKTKESYQGCTVFRFSRRPSRQK